MCASCDYTSWARNMSVKSPQNTGTPTVVQHFVQTNNKEIWKLPISGNLWGESTSNAKPFPCQKVIMLLARVSKITDEQTGTLVTDAFVAQITEPEPDMSCWRYFRHCLHRTLSKWRLSMHLVRSLPFQWEYHRDYIHNYFFRRAYITISHHWFIQ